MTPCVQAHIDDHRILTVTFDAPGRPTNGITPQTLDELAAILSAVDHGDYKPLGVVFTSARPNVFIVGADLATLAGFDRAGALRFAETGQRLLGRIAALPMPTVVVIAGHCLGAGLELALACTYRIAPDDGSLEIGLPEPRLGLTPALGATVTLPRIIGLRRALELLGSGRSIPPRKAKEIGLVDELVDRATLIDAARRLVRDRPKPRRARAVNRWLDAGGLTELIIRRAGRGGEARAATGGPDVCRAAAVELARIATREGEDAGLAAARRSFAQLTQTHECRQLIRTLVLRQEARRWARVGTAAHATPVREAAVVGGGQMGAGITHALVRAGLPVRWVERNAGAMAAALRRVRGLLRAEEREGRIDAAEARRAMARIAPALDWSGLKRADLVVESVVERMEVKRDVFHHLGTLARPDAVIATNTRGLSVSELAEATTGAGRVIGMHFLNPVSRTTMVEIVRGARSDERSVATGAELGSRLGKVPIVVRDGPGRVVDRLLLPYLSEALTLAVEGEGVMRIDGAMRAWGMSLGPMELMDQIGLDTAAAMFDGLGRQIGTTLPAGAKLDLMVRSGFLGRRSGEGFYVHRRRGWGRRGGINTEAMELLGWEAGEVVATGADVPDHVIVGRLVLVMVNEASRMLSEGVVATTEALDLASVLGAGLPGWRGGLVTFAQQAGLKRIVTSMEEMSSRFGPRFSPDSALRHAADTEQPMQAIVGSTAPLRQPHQHV